jgi:hypothetical protein
MGHAIVLGFGFCIGVVLFNIAGEILAGILIAWARKPTKPPKPIRPPVMSRLRLPPLDPDTHFALWRNGVIVLSAGTLGLIVAALAHLI